MTDSTQVEAQFDTPGSLLIQARIAQGFSTADIAQKLRLKAEIIEALEKDEVLSTLSITFTKGYVRSYAKLLGLNEPHIIELFNELHISDDLSPKRMQSFSRKVARDHSDSRWMIVTYSIGALVILLCILWWVQYQSEPFFASQSKVQNIATQDAEIALVEEPNNAVESNDLNRVIALNATEVAYSSARSGSELSPDVNNDAGADVNPDTSPEMTSEMRLDSSPELTDMTPTDSRLTTSSEPANASSMTVSVAATSNQDNSASSIPEFVPNLQPENITQVLTVLENNESDVESELRLFADDNDAAFDSSALVELIFKFSGDCWIKITDATGNDIAYGVKKAGRVMPVSGQPPFSVILGAPRSVNIQYDGQPVDVSFLPSDRTGRFVLPLQD